MPLLTCAYPEVDRAIAAAVAAADVPILVSGHLGPHPFLAEAMHARLSEAGLARIGRAGRISIVTAADGVIVGAAGDPDEAIQIAGVVAVLLASRLTIPTVPALLDDPGALRYAVEQLRAAQVTRVALAPCVVGPEMPAATMTAIAAGRPGMRATARRLPDDRPSRRHALRCRPGGPAAGRRAQLIPHPRPGQTHATAGPAPAPRRGRQR